METNVLYIRLLLTEIFYPMLYTLERKLSNSDTASEIQLITTPSYLKMLFLMPNLDL
jgi:hypothetical protein